MSSRQKKFRIIHVHFREKIIEFEMEKNLHKWEGNNKMFKKLLKSIKSKFKLKTSFSVYDPNDDMFVDDIDDLCGCYIGYENDYKFVLSLHVKAPNEPLKAEKSELPKTTTNYTITNSEKPTSVPIPSLPINDENTSKNEQKTESFMDDMKELDLKPIEDIKAELGISRRKSRRLSVDFSLFTQQTNCEPNTVWLDFGAARIKNCDHINRLVHGLKYFMNLDIISNDIDKDEFNHFIDDIYVNMLDDYLHLITKHSDDLEEIHKALRSKYHLNECDITKCIYTKRHFSIKQKYDDDPWINLYIETYDSLHFWLFHLYAIGLRTMKKDKDVITKHGQNDCYDAVFAKMIENIHQKRMNTDIFERYNTVKKYELTLTSIKDHKALNSERITFRDSLMFNLQNKVETNASLHTLNGYLNKEEYDTDAIMDDVDGEYSNISGSYLIQIKEYIKNTNLSSSTFSIGLILYYWPYYKKPYDNVDDTGYNTLELYVEMKYATFKLEILNYGINIWEYNNLIVLKAKQYQQTKVSKSINIKFNPHLHFDVESGVLTRENLIALVLYTDFDELSAEFASTFRQIRLNESLQSIKRRNQKYWWLSKSLREIVQYFGDNGSPSGQNVKGPFYTAMNDVINVSEFNIRLCSPVSTSTKIEVIARFNGDKGMIIQLNNNGDYENARYLRSFNLSWISKYVEDDERLFIGGDWKIRIETIKLIETKQNFVSYFSALFVFDCICNGSEIKSLIDGKKSANIIGALIDNKLGNDCSDINIPYYIMDTFNTFCCSKRVITLNLYYLDVHFGVFTDLIMNKIEADSSKREDTSWIMPNPYLSKNTLKLRLFRLFDNVHKLVIYSTKYDGFPSYSFSLMSLLSSVEFSSRFKQIIIKAIWFEPTGVNGKRSWIYTMWNTSPLTAVKSMLKETKCKICLMQKANNIGHKEDWLVIDRQ